MGNSCLFILSNMSWPLNDVGQIRFGFISSNSGAFHTYYYIFNFVFYLCCIAYIVVLDGFFHLLFSQFVQCMKVNGTMAYTQEGERETKKYIHLSLFNFLFSLWVHHWNDIIVENCCFYHCFLVALFFLKKTRKYILLWDRNMYRQLATVHNKHRSTQKNKTKTNWTNFHVISRSIWVKM